MPQMSSADATIHAAQGLIYGIQNPAPAIPLVKLVNSYKESLRSLSEIFRKATPPAVPPRVQVRGAYQEKLQHVNQERYEMKNASQSKPFINAEPLRLPIVEAYPEEIQQAHLAKKLKFSNKQKLSSYTKKNENFQK